jgi:hypothetical protein
MNTLAMLLMTTCVTAADPVPVAQPQSIPMSSVDLGEQGWRSRWSNGRPGLLARLRGAFSRNRQPSENVLPGGMRVGEPPLASSPLVPSAGAPVLSPTPVILPNASTPSAGGRVLERMPSGDPGR